MGSTDVESKSLIISLLSIMIKTVNILHYVTEKTTTYLIKNDIQKVHCMVYKKFEFLNNK